MNYGGYQTKHMPDPTKPGASLDVPKALLPPSAIDRLRALGVHVHDEPNIRMMHLDFDKILGKKSLLQMKALANSPDFAGKVQTATAKRAAKPITGLRAEYGTTPATPSAPVTSQRGTPSGPTERLSGAGGVASIRQLYNKARRAPKSQKANAYADVVESLRAYEGEKPLYLEKLEEKFSDMTPRTGLGHYATYFDQGRSWKAPVVGEAAAIEETVTPETPEKLKIPKDKSKILSWKKK